MNPNIQRMTPERVNDALRRLEQIDKDSANLLRNYIRGLESRLDVYILGDDNAIQIGEATTLDVEE